MTEGSPKKLPILCEGADDRATVQGLIRADVLPSWCEPFEPPKGTPDGIEGVARGMADRIDAGQRVVAMRDLDDESPREALDTLLARARAGRSNLQLGEFLAERDEGLFRGKAKGTNGEVDVVVVVVGAKDDVRLSALGIDRWAIDDYLLRLVLEPDAYCSFATSEKYAEQDHVRVLGKTAELRDLFQRNGIPLRSSKRYLHLLRGVIDFRGSPATFADLLVARAIRELARPRVETLLSPLLAHLRDGVSGFGGQ